jgi:hypothetical protein
LKLSSLFAKYLYQQKVLRLPGIGVFSLDPSITVPDISDKLFPDFLQNIQFKQQAVNAPDEDFINFIRAETGKIKPLAESDLDSYLSDGKILLNIGKPFQIDGIGQIHKTRDGVLEFKAGDPNHQKSEVHHEGDEPVQKSKPFFLETSKSSSSRKILIGLGIVTGIVIIILGGYMLSNRNNGTSEAAASSGDSLTTLLSDTTAISKMPDSFQREKADSSSRSTYKFIIEKTTNKGRASRRYNQLSGNFTPIKMETQDSTLFKLYFQLPATPADTARIRDSLKTWYARKVVYVE